MGQYKGRVTEIRFDLRGQMEAFIDCPAAAVPHPGQYLLASDPDDPATVLGVPIFNAGQEEGGFWAAPTYLHYGSRESAWTWRVRLGMDLICQ